MNDLTIGLLGALLATNQPVAVSNVIQQNVGVAVKVAADPVDEELHAVMVDDDAALDDSQKWIQEFDALSETNRTKSASAEVNRKIMSRFDGVRAAYAKYLQKHPDSAKGYLAYGSFLGDTGDEEGATTQYENSRQLDPKNPAVWNNLANIYGEFGPQTKAFEYYTQAIKLEPTEPIYYQNFATTVYLFRKDAREYYHLDEQQVFDKALGLYKQAMAIAPDNFTLATDYAESYYGIKPMLTNDALAAWTNAMKVAHTDAERQGIDIHLARVKISIGEYSEASNHLARVTEPAYQDLKRRLYRSLLDHKNPPPDDLPDITTNRAARIPVMSTNYSAVSTNASALPTNLFVAPLPSREQKSQ